MEAGSRVLVTGASGFVGSAVARALTAQGASVRVLMRPTSPRKNIEDLSAETVIGDMRDPESMGEALRDVRYLFHVAADYRLWARNPDEILQTNIDGTRVVMEAALAAGVEKIVYTSSVATLRLSATDNTPVDETSPLTEEDAIGTYKRSKVAAERLVEKMISERGLPAVIVNPSTPIGPRDIKPTPTGRIIIEAANGGMPAFVDTGLNLVHVDDVAAGHLLACEHGRIGERYILGGDDMALGDMLGVIAELTSRRAPRTRLPRGPLYPLAYAAEAIAGITGKEPFVTVDGLKMSRYRMFFSSQKAETQLGYKARPAREGLSDALDWFRAEGYLKR